VFKSREHVVGVSASHGRNTLDSFDGRAVLNVHEYGLMRASRML
jgi:hypothetical protein